MATPNHSENVTGYNKNAQVSLGVLAFSVARKLLPA
jgi:hypothetical protein